ncbi:hypothetical protein [Flavobacterium branchiicola]|uniref:Lipoprotein n=1 Tax=Flavobacterium branchiicola TaxID=1114875 RepID=A0ABV9PHX0_9FLAO|nr:hypothetical protein [Flavobacterium branchiicola]MBS7256305.1 hypothetical protein [Flavobacterium branchiicola]
MNFKYFIFIFLLFTSCKEATEKKPSSLKSGLTKSKIGLENNNEAKPEKDSKIVEIGYYDKLENLPHFKLDSIEETAYNNITWVKSFKITKLEERNDFFYIQGVNQKFEFKKYKDYKGELSWSGYEYFGNCASLSLVALEELSTADHLGFSEMQLLDTSNDYLYKIISLGDSSVSVPELSPDNRYMVYFQNPEYESKDLTIVILKVNDKNSPVRFLTEYKSCFTKSDNSIEEIKWKSNNVIFIKAYKSIGFDSNGKELRDYFYYKAEI